MGKPKKPTKKELRAAAKRLARRRTGERSADARSKAAAALLGRAGGLIGGKATGGEKARAARENLLAAEKSAFWKARAARENLKLAWAARRKNCADARAARLSDPQFSLPFATR